MFSVKTIGGGVLAYRGDGVSPCNAAGAEKHFFIKHFISREKQFGATSFECFSCDLWDHPILFLAGFSSEIQKVDIVNRQSKECK